MTAARNPAVWRNDPLLVQRVGALEAQVRRLDEELRIATYENERLRRELEKERAE